MTPYKFDAPNADAILRSSDGKELRVHRLILNLSSLVFQTMFAMPQSTGPPSQILPVIDLSDPSDVLEPFIQYLYPLPQPKITDTSMWAALYAIADKYNVEYLMEWLRAELIPLFLDASPLQVYALASRWGFNEEAKIASKRTLKMDISKGFPQEVAELMGGVACQRLYRLHINRRTAARALVENHPPPDSEISCTCDPHKFKPVISALSQRVSTIPWLTMKEVEEEKIDEFDIDICDMDCRHGGMAVHGYFTSILNAMSNLPQTI